MSASQDEILSLKSNAVPKFEVEHDTIATLTKHTERLDGLRAWRHSRLETLTLPSGLVVTAKRVNLLDLAASGNIPTPLLGEADELISKGGKTFELKDFPKFAELIRPLMKIIIADPPVADHADENHLGLDEIPMDDQMELFNWSQGEAKKMAPFPAQQKPSAPAPSGGEELRDPAQRDSGHPRTL